MEPEGGSWPGTCLKLRVFGHLLPGTVHAVYYSEVRLFFIFGFGFIFDMWLFAKGKVLQATHLATVSTAWAISQKCFGAKYLASRVSSSRKKPSLTDHSFFHLNMFTSTGSAILVSLSTLLLIHSLVLIPSNPCVSSAKCCSCYSAYEHSLLSIPTNNLPLDITLETLTSVFLLCVGIVLNNSQELKPISWSVWCGQLERERGSGPYGFLEERLGFLDIRVSAILNVPEK